MKNNYQNLLNNIQKDEEVPKLDKHDKIMIIDGLNLFIRNFSILNFINESGSHIGGLGGFLRSLGSLINLIKPTTVYIIFDGIGSTINRKNILPEYKSGRNVTRLTNWNAFGDLEAENKSKTDQIIRLIHYLKCLPVKIISLDKVEADDVIAHLSHIHSNEENSKTFIISADQDFTQLVNDKITTYRPLNKEFFTPEKIKTVYNILPSNFIIYKTLMGDQSDVVAGIKGLGKGKILKLFPELIDTPLTLEDIKEICTRKYKDHIIYSRILFEFNNLERNYRIMNLSNPLLDEKEKQIIRELKISNPNQYNPSQFIQLYNEDGLNNTIKNPSYWLRETFSYLNSFNK